MVATTATTYADTSLGSPTYAITWPRTRISRNAVKLITSAENSYIVRRMTHNTSMR